MKTKQNKYADSLDLYNAAMEYAEAHLRWAKSGGFDDIMVIEAAKTNLKLVAKSYSAGVLINEELEKLKL